MKTETKNTAKVVLSKDDLLELLNDNLFKLTGQKLLGYEIIGVTDRTKTHWEQGADPHDAFPVELFDGLEVILELKQ